jgi:hypothetical protein
MLPMLQLWSTSTLILVMTMLISASLTGDGIPVAYSRFALAATASACLLLVMRRWWQRAIVRRLKPLVRPLSVKAMGRSDVGVPVRGNDEISRLENLVSQVCSGRNTHSEVCPDRRPEFAVAPISRGLSGNLRLAAEHLESIKTLLEVSQSHQQPIPRAALQNLELVAKSLRDIERKFGVSSQDARLDGTLQFG